MEHKRYKCQSRYGYDCYCPVCQGDLFICSVCGGAEGTLTTECCGHLVADRWLTCFVYKGKVDYRGGEWCLSRFYPAKRGTKPSPRIERQDTRLSAMSLLTAP